MTRPNRQASLWIHTDIPKSELPSRANSSSSSARPPRMNPSGLPWLNLTEFRTYDWWKLPGTGNFRLDGKGKADKGEMEWRRLPGAGTFKMAKSSDENAASRTGADGDPPSRGKKNPRPKIVYEDALPPAKRARHEDREASFTLAEESSSCIAPERTELSPSTPDWMEAQSRYLTAVLWQDDEAF